MAVYTSPLDPSVPVIQFTFTESAFKNVLNSWRPTDIARFKGHFAIDFPFLLCYGVLGYLISKRTRLFRHFRDRTISLFAALLPIAAAADAIENALHLYFVFGTGTVLHALYLAAGIAASAKWMLIVAFVGSSAYALRKYVC